MRKMKRGKLKSWSEGFLRLHNMALKLLVPWRQVARKWKKWWYVEGWEMAVSFWLYSVFIFVLTLMYFDTEQGVDIRSGTEVRGHSKFSERNIFLMKIFEAILKSLHIFTFSSFCFYFTYSLLCLCRFHYFFLIASLPLSSSFHFLSYSSLSLSSFIILYLFFVVDSSSHIFTSFFHFISSFVYFSSWKNCLEIIWFCLYFSIYFYCICFEGFFSPHFCLSLKFHSQGCILGICLKRQVSRIQLLIHSAITN